MKKPLSKILARMAKDGDVESVAEFIEELIGEQPETPAEAVAEAAAEVVEEVVETAAPAAEETVTVEVPENHEITIDEESLAGILQRLDQLIALLTPAAPAGDEDPEAAEAAEEVAEVVEEVLEAVQAEAGEPDSGEPVSAEEEVAQVVEAILEPAVSTVIEEQGDETCDPEDPENPGNVGSDALRAALMAVRPALAKMTPAQRKKAGRDIAARLPRRSPNGKDSIYASRTGGPSSYADLGKRIMEKRNPHFHQ